MKLVALTSLFVVCKGASWNVDRRIAGCANIANVIVPFLLCGVLRWIAHASEDEQEFGLFGDYAMIRKVLIAGHGDVAIRLLMEFRRAGVTTITVYTMQDCNSKHVQLADEAICIGETPKSYYSDWHRIISAAEISEVDAIHPGDGPLSAHERFAEVCAEIGV